MRPFRCPITILNTLDLLGKFEGKANEGFLVGYSINSKAFRVFNSRIRKVEENLHIKFLENKSNVARSGPEWLFDIDSLTKSINYEPVTTGNQTNDDKGIETNINAGKAGQEKESDHEYILLPFMPSDSPLSSSLDQERTDSSTQDINTVGPSINTVSTNINTGSLNINTVSSNDPSMPSLEETGIFDGAYDDEDVGAEADLINFGDNHKSILASREEQITKIIRTAYLPVFSLNKNLKRNKKVRNKARLVEQGYTQEEGINYDEVFALVARIEAIRLFLAYASFMGFIVYQINVKSAFLYGTIEEEVYVCQPPVLKIHSSLIKFIRLSPEGTEGRYSVSAGTTSTPIETNKALIKDKEAKDVDVHLYRSMIGSLMYLTASRPDIMFAVCACARYALIKNPTIYVSLIEKFWQTASVRTVDNGEQEINATVDGKEFTITEASVRRHLQLANADREGCSVERAATIATSLEVVQDSSNIAKTQSTATPTEPISQETGSDGGPKRQETMGDASVQTRFERASKLSYDSPLGGGNTPRSDKDSMTLQELMTLCTKLSDRVLALETNLR
ncbi:putative ribonuclease H-like domain-containing protein [Tanacetum coccineum]